MIVRFLGTGRVWLAACLLVALAGSASGEVPRVKGDLRVRGRAFVDGSGREVVLRGVNLAGDSKVPPFLPIRDPRELDCLPRLGFNVVRLVFVWEAIEPRPGFYDADYLNAMRAVVVELAARGLYVIVDIHQDGFSRYLSRGSGDGFPSWAVSSSARLATPDSDEKHKHWPLLMATDPAMHRSFSEFYADTEGVRSRYLLMVRHLARMFADEPGVIGYDLLNEPWGHEKTEIAPLYRDASRVIRSEDPTAILFLEGHVTTNTGVQTHLTPPDFDNAVYSPHYYKPTTILTGLWLGETHSIRNAFKLMDAKAEEWGVPLFLSEFGVSATTCGGGDYIAYLYEKMDDYLASGAQWNYTPGWDPIRKDGWNGEDFTIIDPRTGQIRKNFRPRPYPRATAGHLAGFRYEEQPGYIDMIWVNDPAQGETEIFFPNALFPGGSTIQVEPAGASWRVDAQNQTLLIRSSQPGRIRVRVHGPT